MSCDLDLDAHAIERECLDANASQYWLMVRAVFSKIANQVLSRFHVQKVAADLVDLLPALPAGLLQGVLDVRKCLVDLLAQVAWNLLGNAVPSACFHVVRFHKRTCSGGIDLEQDC